MSDAERDPHVLVSARATHHGKLVGLPNDRARWGWVALLGAAKLRRPPGEFESRAVVCTDLGWYGRFLDDYLRVGLLHLAPVTCAGCLEKAPQWASLREGSIVVHDWHRHQRTSTQKVKEWRSENDISSGHETKGKRTGNPGETEGKPLPSRALSHSLSESSSTDDGEGGPGGEDDEPEFVLRQWLIQRGCLVREGDGFDQRLITACEVHGADAILAQFVRLEGLGVKRGDVQGYVFGAIDALNAQSRPRPRALEDNGAAERAAVRSRRIDEDVWKRRVDWYHNTGQWDATWGDPPERKSAPA